MQLFQFLESHITKVPAGFTLKRVKRYFKHVFQLKLTNESERKAKIDRLLCDLDSIGYDCTHVRHNVYSWDTVTITYGALQYDGRMKELVHALVHKNNMSKGMKKEYQRLVATNPHLKGSKIDFFTPFL